MKSLIGMINVSTLAHTSLEIVLLVGDFRTVICIQFQLIDNR